MVALNTIDLAGMTLVVSDIQTGATTAGIGATGKSVSSAAFSSQSLTGGEFLLTGQTTATAASATAFLTVGTTATAVSMYYGTGTPSGQLSAITGSIYVNAGGSGTSNRAFINSGGTTWVGVITSG